MSDSGTRKPILVRGARQLLTLRGPSGPRRGSAMRELGVIQDGALLIVDGIIHDIGPSRRVENLAAARNADEISADGRVVMPGFVDSRTYLVCGPPLLDEYEARIETPENGGGVQSATGYDRTLQALRTSSKQRLELDARKTIREFIRHGTTSIEATATFDPESRSELKVLRVLAAVSDKPLDVIPTFQAGSPEILDAGPAEGDSNTHGTLAGLRAKRLARFVDIECGPGGLPPKEVRRILGEARELGFQISVTAELKEPSPGVQVAVELNAIRVSRIECISGDDVDVLARSSTIATLLPGAAFHTRYDRYPPGRDLIDRGAAIAIASGFSTGKLPYLQHARDPLPRM